MVINEKLKEKYDGKTLTTVEINSFFINIGNRKNEIKLI
jgi:hypothetical protein